MEVIALIASAFAFLTAGQAVNKVNKLEKQLQAAKVLAETPEAE
jgi:hypothetical protein